MEDDSVRQKFWHAVGDRVVKFSGDYQLTGTVVATFHKRSGAARYVVEADNPPGLLMIYNCDQLREEE